MNSNIIYDDLGRPIEFSSTQRVHNKSSLTTALSVMRGITELISTSLGPNGNDKLILDQDDNVSVTNDGATILKMMDVTNPIGKMVVELSEAQDDEIGDGTTSVVLLAGELLEQAVELINRGMHPLKLINGLERISLDICKYLEDVSEKLDFKDVLKVVKTCLDSKIARKSEQIGKICVEAVEKVADFERKDVDFDLIRIEGKIGMDLNDTQLINGVVIDKEFSHPQMKKIHENVKIAVLTVPFEPPKLKTKNMLTISSVEEYQKLSEYEKMKFQEMIDSLKNAGANLVLCQWGFDDEANSLLMENNLPAIRWVGGPELEAIALHLNANIISRFEDLKSDDLGIGNVKEISIGTQNEKIIIIESPQNKSKTVTILVRGGNQMVLEEVKRCIRDALCSVRNILKNPKIVYGGGSIEMHLSNYLKKFDDEISHAFGRALLKIPMILAKNSGLDPYMSITQSQIYHGIDCLGLGVDMKKNGVMEPLISKQQQIKMAVQLVSSLLKIDDIIYINE